MSTHTDTAWPFAELALDDSDDYEVVEVVDPGAAVAPPDGTALRAAWGRGFMAGVNATKQAPECGSVAALQKQIHDLRRQAVMAKKAEDGLRQQVIDLKERALWAEEKYETAKIEKTKAQQKAKRYWGTIEETEKELQFLRKNTRVVTTREKIGAEQHAAAIKLQVWWLRLTQDYYCRHFTELRDATHWPQEGLRETRKQLASCLKTIGTAATAANKLLKDVHEHTYSLNCARRVEGLEFLASHPGTEDPRYSLPDPCEAPDCQSGDCLLQELLEALPHYEGPGPLAAGQSYFDPLPSDGAVPDEPAPPRGYPKPRRQPKWSNPAALAAAVGSVQDDWPSPAAAAAAAAAAVASAQDDWPDEPCPSNPCPPEPYSEA